MGSCAAAAAAAAACCALDTFLGLCAQIEPVPPALVSSLGSEDELLEEAQWVSDMVRCWCAARRVWRQTPC